MHSNAGIQQATFGDFGDVEFPHDTLSILEPGWGSALAEQLQSAWHRWICPKQDVLLGKSAGCKVMFRCLTEHPSENLIIPVVSMFYLFFRCWIPNLSCSVPYLHWWNAYFTGSMPMLLSLVAVLPAAAMLILHVSPFLIIWCPPCVFMRLSSSHWRGAGPTAPFHGGRRQHP